MNNKAAQAYIQTKVGTTDQGQLLLLLYDGALRFLQQAREKMLAKDYAGKPPQAPARLPDTEPE